MPPDQLSTTPIAAAMLYRQGVVLFDLCRPEDAIRLLKAAVTIDDQFAVALAALAAAEAELFDDDRWRPSIERASRRARSPSRATARRDHPTGAPGPPGQGSALGREHCRIPRRRARPARVARRGATSTTWSSQPLLISQC